MEQCLPKYVQKSFPAQNSKASQTQSSGRVKMFSKFYLHVLFITHVPFSRSHCFTKERVEEGENKARKKMQYSGNRGSKSEESRTVGTEEGGPKDCQASGLERSQCRSQQEEAGQAQEGAWKGRGDQWSAWCFWPCGEGFYNALRVGGIILIDS